MQKSIRKTLQLSAAAGAILVGGLLTAAPAAAGGGSVGGASGPNYELCQARLEYAIEITRAQGYDVYGVTNCFRQGGGSTWYGYYGY